MLAIKRKHPHFLDNVSQMTTLMKDDLVLGSLISKISSHMGFLINPLCLDIQ